MTRANLTTFASANEHFFRIDRTKNPSQKPTNFLIRKKSILIPSEQKYYRKLLEEYGDQYFIFPQLNLDKIIEVTDSLHYYSYFNKINQKSVDFVLVDKQTFAQVKVIELDDPTHLWKSRKERDIFVNQLFTNCNLVFERKQSK